jgi:hypothetical protein
MALKKENSRDFNAPYKKERALPHININPTQDRNVAPSVMTVQRGVLDAGVVGDLAVPDGNIVEISELNGVDPLRVDFDFVGIEVPKNIYLFAHYDGGGTHIICAEIELIAGGWENVGEIGLEADFKWYHFPVYFSDRYVNAGAMKIRLRHIQNGVNSHDLLMDCLGIIHTTI